MGAKLAHRDLAREARNLNNQPFQELQILA